jgi:hypothetical protein
MTAKLSQCDKVAYENYGLIKLIFQFNPSFIVKDNSVY